MDFEDRHIVVTGGTGALGTAVVGRLLNSGAMCHVPNFNATELKQYLYREDSRVRLVGAVDLTSEQEVNQFYDELPELWASIHLAGGFAMSPISDTNAAAFTDQIDMNALTCFLCCRAAVRRIRNSLVPHEVSANGGRIVNVAARPALEPRLGAGMVAYTAAKAAVVAITQSLAEELAGENIWVNAVAPSILDTPVNRAAMPDADNSEWPKLDDVAETITFLASPENRTTRGGVIPVYGRS
jgi:NAD(P)-dependent dehydrogenase (short-subunit alcohol dehydrogenase family)